MNNYLSLTSVNPFSGLNPASGILSLSAVASGTGLVIVYATDSVISSLALTGGSAGSIAASAATFTVAGGIASIWCLQNGAGVTAIAPTISTAATYMSACVYQVMNTSWTVVGAGNCSLYNYVPAKPGSLLGVPLQGEVHGIPNLFIAAMENIAAGLNESVPVTVDSPWSVDLNDAAGCFVHLIGEGTQQPVFEHETFGQPLATVGVVINGFIVLSISPVIAHININATQQYTVTPGVTVTWSCSAGTISATGLYTAPGTPGTYTVTATSAILGESASATVIVTGGS